MAFKYQMYQRSLAGDEQAKNAVRYDLGIFSALAEQLTDSQFAVLTGIFKLPQEQFESTMQEIGDTIRDPVQIAAKLDELSQLSQTGESREEMGERADRIETSATPQDPALAQAQEKMQELLTRLQSFVWI